MAGERFRPIEREINRPTGRVMQPSGFSLASSTNLEAKRAGRLFRFDPERWPETGGYPPIAGGSGQDEGSESQPTPDDGTVSREALFDYLRSVYRNPRYTVYFEIQLERIGLVSGLEESGILPTAQNPNPFSPDVQATEHATWSEAHVTDMERFARDFAKRDEVIAYLFVGSLIGHLCDDLFPRK